jgi:N-acylneuraminate cytidylyltransferase
MSSVAIIPVKAESKRLPGKNFLRVGSRSLVQLAVQVAFDAKHAGIVNDIVVSYDVWDNALYSGTVGVGMHQQNAPLPTRTLEVVQELIEPAHVGHDLGLRVPAYAGHDLVLLLLPTSPLRTLRHIVESRLLLRDDDDAVMSMVPFRQDYRYMCFQDPGSGMLDLADSHDWPTGGLKHDGTVLWARTGWLRTHPADWYSSSHIRPYLMKPEESVDVDDEIDLLLANALAARPKS